jgi:hypothetical protein
MAGVSSYLVDTNVLLGLSQAVHPNQVQASPR